MAPIDRLLAPGERVHLMSREHGVVLVRPFVGAAVVVAAAAAVAIAVAGQQALGPFRIVLAVAAALAAARALLHLVRAVARWQRRMLVVTDRRLVLFAGGLAQQAAVVPLHAITDIEIVRPPAGRMLHYGGVVVSSGGRRGLLFGLRRLPDPDLLLGLLFGLAEERPRPRRRLTRPLVPGALR
jgi:membrane protein YdbS with pleckstrin-like domain